jgi:saccharopine dehydrogenase (NADP+, L-glutamate forming)
MSQKKVLVLGSGLVAKPCIEYLLRDPNNKLTVASRTLSTAEKLVAGFPRATAVALDVTSPELDTIIANHDVVISLVPFIHHADVIRSAIKGKTHVVTTSYVSPAMRELDAAAKEAGITVVNEVGVDPGVDHLYAVKTIEEVHGKGGQVLEFYSYCGGLVAPEIANDNPLKFKFSWSPRGVLLSQFNSATFYKDGKVVHIPNKELMAQAVPATVDGYSLVAYPNRDSTPFREFYNIPEAHTIIRGSLRYEDNPVLVKALIDLGWVDPSEKTWLKDSTLTWAAIQQHLTQAASSAESDLIDKVDQLCTFSSTTVREQVLTGLRWMGLFSDEQASVRGNLLDTLSARLEQLCSFRPGERDLVLLQHKFVVRWEDGSEVSVTTHHAKTLADLTLDRTQSLPLWSSSAIRMGTPQCPSLLE